MPRYVVQHKYGSGTFGPWAAGIEVDLPEDVAAWVNRDSEGTLAPVDATPASAEPELDGADGAGENDTDPEPDGQTPPDPGPATEPEPPATRPHKGGRRRG